jgi:hypothetical protein
MFTPTLQSAQTMVSLTAGKSKIRKSEIKEIEAQKFRNSERRKHGHIHLVVVFAFVA